MITYNEHPWLREQFADYRLETFKFRYSLAHRDKQDPNTFKNTKDELLILNYGVTEVQEKNNILAELLDSV